MSAAQSQSTIGDWPDFPQHTIKPVWHRIGIRQLYYTHRMKRSTIAFTLLGLIFLAACSSSTPAPATLPPNQPSVIAPAATASLLAATATTSPPTAGPTQPVATPNAPTVAATETITPTATADPALAGGLMGLWQGNNNSFYLFNKDGTWNWDQKGDRVMLRPENQGHWWMEGDVIHIQDLSGKAPCPANQIGLYQAQLSGDNLELAAVNDPCTVRIGQTSGTYGRQAGGP